MVAVRAFVASEFATPMLFVEAHSPVQLLMGVAPGPGSW